MDKGTTPAADFQTENLLFDLEPVSGKKVTADFTAPALSFFGGLALLREYEGTAKILDRITSCLHDNRNPKFIVHPLAEMIRQRVFQIAAGYEDADDCDRFRGDSILKMCCGRRPEDEIDLCSQPTMTRERVFILQRLRHLPAA